ncbi:HNH endonuclease [Candidatus Pacearchaeota archaeon]|nr:HNH endonuclease [Candidatus Pacearchaeota archaeon]
MKQIELTRGFTTIIDDADCDLVPPISWQVNQNYNTCYAMGILDGKRVFVHRLIMNARKGQIIDHVNGDGLDNRRCNLRFCTPSQNQQNSRKRAGCSSKYKGVSWVKREKKWRAAIKYKGKSSTLGHYDNESDAARVYDKKAKEIFGEFARLNFPTPEGKE